MPVEKYDKSVSTLLSIYCWFQFLLVLLLYEAVVPVVKVRRLISSFLLLSLIQTVAEVAARFPLAVNSGSGTGLYSEAISLN